MNRIFFEIESRREANKITYYAKIQMSDLLKNKLPDTDLTKKLEWLENRYRQTIGVGLKRLKRIRTFKGEEKVSLYWDIADRIKRYLQTTEKRGFFLNNYYKHFARDLFVSRATIERLMRLRKNVTDKAQLDLSKPWTYYTRRYYRLRLARDERTNR